MSGIAQHVRLTRAPGASVSVGAPMRQCIFYGNTATPVIHNLTLLDTLRLSSYLRLCSTGVSPIPTSSCPSMHAPSVSYRSPARRARLRRNARPSFLFFLYATASTQIYTPSLPDDLPIYLVADSALLRSLVCRLLLGASHRSP